MTAVAGAVLLPLGRATAKPSPVVTGAMPQASLDIEGDGEAEPCCQRSCRAVGARGGACDCADRRGRAQPSPVIIEARPKVQSRLAKGSCAGTSTIAKCRTFRVRTT